MTEEETKSVRIHKNLSDRLDKFIDAYEKAYGIKISFVQASLLLNVKIEKIGGLKV